MPTLPPAPGYAAHAVQTDGALADVRLEVGGRVWRLAGRGGAAAERERAQRVLADAGKAGRGLPVFVGAGLGAGIAAARQAGIEPVFVVDREATIDAVTNVRAAFASDPAVRFLDDPDPDRAAATVADAARTSGFARLDVVVHPLYPRLDPAYYGAVTARLAQYAAFRERLAYPKFTAPLPRVLILWRPYFLYQEIEAALTRLGAPYHRVGTGSADRGEAGTVEAILTAVAQFRPDFALTVNHLGLDREGRLAGLLSDLGLPLASWFVDSPRLILHDYKALATPGAMVFTYDADALPELADLGFAHAQWLPLATDPHRFKPLESPPARPAWQARTSFVGASMVAQAAKALARLDACPGLRPILPQAAAAFVRSPERSARLFLQSRPDWAQAYAALPPGQARLDAELALTWEATRQYRLACVRGILPFSPCIAGDAGWETLLPGVGRDWKRLPELDYYDELPGFYPSSEVNLNCTSLQMKGAVNQRVFDVPACGAFVLTDAREQLAALFAPGAETAVYADPAEVPQLTRHYLEHPGERRRVSQAARARILAEHTYDHRLTTLFAAMRQAFGELGRCHHASGGQGSALDPQGG